jgi:hypothetical protein
MPKEAMPHDAHPLDPHVKAKIIHAEVLTISASADDPSLSLISRNQPPLSFQALSGWRILLRAGHR